MQNGDAAALAKDRDLLFSHRYLLSPAVNPGRFTVDGLRQAIGDSIDLLASPAGLMIKSLLPRDPTGEMIELVGALGADHGPASAHGVWMSRDGRRALLMAQQNAVTTRMQAEADKEAVQQAASEQLRSGTFQPSPSRTW